MIQQQYKILFAGPVGVGKTTAIAALSDYPPLTTEQKATDETANKKEMTTVAMDYGSIKLDENNMVHLYGTPGQEKFDFMWRILAEGAIGLIILVDHATKDPIGDLNAYLESFKDFFFPNQIAIGINKFFPEIRPALSDYIQAAKNLELPVPVFEIDAREREDVLMLAQALLLNIDPSLSEESA